MLRLLLRERHAVHHKQFFFRPFSSGNKDVESVTKASASVPEDPEQQQSVRKLIVDLPSPNNKLVKSVFVPLPLNVSNDFKNIPPVLDGEVIFCTRVETIDRAKNKGRIKVCNYMILATIVGCFFMVWSGKQAAQRGESVHKMNTDWHKAVKEGRA